MLGPAPALCLNIKGVSGVLVPLRLLLKVLVEGLSVGLHKGELVLPLCKGKSLICLFTAGEHLKAPLCCQTEEVVFTSEAFELCRVLKPVQLLGLWNPDISFSDDKFEIELDGVETLFK